MKVHNDPRHSARILALQSIFQSTEGSTSFDIKDIQEMDEVSKYDLGLFTNLTKELPTHRDEIKTLLKSIAIERPLEDISKTNLIILELAILETNILKLTPRKVAIDEAIELAREFGSDTDSKFVNGVLDKALTKMNDLEKKNLKELSSKLGVKFKDLSLLKKALIHRSYLNENGVEESNERLEFLGDAVLELLTSRFLFDNYQASTEGDLTSFRAALVRTESLAETSKDLLIGQYIYMSKGEETTGGRDRTYILANTFEAILGAIYMDQGLESCNTFLSKLLYVKINEIVENRLDIDAKSRLQELAQETLKVTPTYETLSEEGPDHSKTFKMAVFLGDKKYGVGEGHSKQMAEQKSASEALKKLQK